MPAIDWFALAGSGYTGQARARVDADGLVRLSGTLTTTVAGIYAGGAGATITIPVVAQPIPAAIPAYFDWSGAAGSMNVFLLAITPLNLACYSPAGAVLNLATIAWQGTAPPADPAQPRNNTPATFVLAGLTFNTGAPDAFGVRWFASIVDGADSPEQDLEVERRTGAHGVYFAGGWYGRRPLLLEGQVVAENLNAMKAARSRLMAAADLLRALGVLEVNDPGGPWRAEVYRADRPRFSIESGYYATFTLPLASPDHRRHGQTLGRLSSNISAISAGVVAPVVANVSAGGGTASQVQATNAGNTPAAAIIRLAGPLTDPVITHDETGSTIRFAGLILLAGDVLEVDLNRRTITLAGVSRRQFVAGPAAWFMLAPGANTIRFAAASTDPAATMTVEWRDAYL